MNRSIFVFVLATVSFAGVAKELPCSIKAKRLDADTKMLVRVSELAARDEALRQVKAIGATITSGGLEVEDGCLLYTYDVKVPGRSGVEEVVIDAGTGKVLGIEHESAAKEAAEASAQKARKK